MWMGNSTLSVFCSVADSFYLKLGFKRKKKEQFWFKKKKPQNQQNPPGTQQQQTAQSTNAFDTWSLFCLFQVLCFLVNALHFVQPQW